MKDEQKPGPPSLTTRAAAEKLAREKREAAALRANLARRKTQARARTAEKEQPKG